MQRTRLLLRMLKYLPPTLALWIILGILMGIPGEILWWSLNSVAERALFHAVAGSLVLGTLWVLSALYYTVKGEDWMGRN